MEQIPLINKDLKEKFFINGRIIDIVKKSNPKASALQIGVY
jgi:hypothetical protein